ncbi:hypothetical protein [Rhizobium leguminosarum]|uniref:hypothetical protein n=1 Tax=Rhizobium leguminosarum TaxID=384 RepID=UPI003D072452
MNHFTPFLPAEALINVSRISDERQADLETRLLRAVRMRWRAQRIAEAALLLSVSFTLALAFVLKL